MATEPTRTACFQPDEYEDLHLFANRSALREELSRMLASFLEPGAPGQARVLVRGQRGVGKSMLSRAAIADVVRELGPLSVVVDGARTGHGPETFLRELARRLAQEAIRNATDSFVRDFAQFLLRFANATRVQTKQVRSWTSALTGSLKLTDKLSDLLGVEFGIGGSKTHSLTSEDLADRTVDATLLQEMIQAFLSDSLSRNQTIILLLDNLDQVGYAEIEEDVRRVNDLARYLLGLRGCVVVANLRTEFVSADLRKLQSNVVEVPGMQPAELMEVFASRAKARGEETLGILDKGGLLDLAQRLSTWTNNAWGFLVWMAFLDYERLELPVDDAGLQQLMKKYAARHHTGVVWEELESLGALFSGDYAAFRTEAEMKSAEISSELRQRAVKYGALVPDWLLSPDRYMLAPGLHFLARR